MKSIRIRTVSSCFGVEIWPILVSLLALLFSNVEIGVTTWLSHGGPVIQQCFAGEPDKKAEATQPTPKRDTSFTYTLGTHRQSYFKLDGKGSLELQDQLPYRSERTYRFQRTIHPHQTAIVIMDPWIDMASEHLNKYYGQIADTRIVPFVRHALRMGHPILVLTNKPELVKYNTGIHPELVRLEAKGKIKTLYHQDLDDKEFASYLRGKGVHSLVYIGFASNMCVIGRRMGMIPMVHQGFRLFFVPKASAAVEYPDTWEDQSIHLATTKIISQWIAEIVDYDEFMRVGPPAEAAASNE